MRTPNLPVATFIAQRSSARSPAFHQAPKYVFGGRGGPRLIGIR
jgi:hypothetical protein